MKRWLDDLRDPLTFDPGPDSIMGRRAMAVLRRHGRDGWTWAKSVSEAREILLRGGVFVLSCDSDLGTGYEQGRCLIDWLEEHAVLHDEFVPPVHIYAHTGNTVDREAMGVAITRIHERARRSRGGVAF